ncbi:MAG: hypothetical protein IJ644_00350 [Oscillospiraceae bacterium]|nr:hypothetical protein [Oscillospiraceae bacterium]
MWIWLFILLVIVTLTTTTISFFVRETNKLKKAGKVFLILLSLYFVPTGLQRLFVPISRSNESVQKYVMKSLPLGTSWEDAIQIIDDKEWKLDGIYPDYGLLVSNIDSHCYGIGIASGDSDLENHGVKSMKIYLGETHIMYPQHLFLIFPNDVSAYLAFDENEKLTEIIIHRDIDAL